MAKSVSDISFEDFAAFFCSRGAISSKNQDFLVPGPPTRIGMG